MTLLTYQVFKTVADIGSFHKAADILGLTPSAVSHTITNMEKELGFTVLSRSKSGISLTNYGEKILPYINRLSCKIRHFFDISRRFTNKFNFINNQSNSTWNLPKQFTNIQSFGKIQINSWKCISYIQEQLLHLYKPSKTYCL